MRSFLAVAQGLTDQQPDHTGESHQGYDIDDEARLEVQPAA